MVRFLSFSLLLFISFLLEQSVLLPFGLSPGGFLVSFLIFAAGVSLLNGDAKWWFIACASIGAGVFSVIPLFSFLLFVCGGALFLAVKRLIPTEGVFSFLAVLWWGATSYLVALSFLGGSGWMVGFAGTPPIASFRLFFVSVILFALWLLVPASIAWWLIAYWRGNRRFYALNAKR